MGHSSQRSRSSQPQPARREGARGPGTGRAVPMPHREQLGTSWGPHTPRSAERQSLSRTPSTVHNAFDVQERLTHRPGGQGVAGSNPTVPTGSLGFSNLFLSQESPQEGRSSCETPPKGTQPRPRRTTRAIVDTEEPATSASEGIKDRERGRDPAAQVLLTRSVDPVRDVVAGLACWLSSAT
jgi:hypothetical protein